jgi:hypothetical protein
MKGARAAPRSWFPTGRQSGSVDRDRLRAEHGPRVGGALPALPGGAPQDHGGRARLEGRDRGFGEDARRFAEGVRRPAAAGKGERIRTKPSDEVTMPRWAESVAGCLLAILARPPSDPLQQVRDKRRTCSKHEEGVGLVHVGVAFIEQRVTDTLLVTRPAVQRRKSVPHASMHCRLSLQDGKRLRQLRFITAGKNPCYQRQRVDALSDAICKEAVVKRLGCLPHVRLGTLELSGAQITQGVG